MLCEAFNRYSLAHLQVHSHLLYLTKLHMAITQLQRIFGYKHVFPAKYALYFVSA